MGKDEEEKGRVAYHEAGHAVIPWMFGVHSDLQWIDMRGTRLVLGSVRCRDVMVHAIQGNWDRRNPESVLVRRHEGVRSVMHYFAGPAAAYRADPDPDHPWFDQLMEDNDVWGDDDAALPIRLAQALHGDTGRAWWQFLCRMAQWTDEALSHPRLWAVVEALADRLQRTRTRLSASTANRIMDRAWGLPATTFPLQHMGHKWRRRTRLKAACLAAGDRPAVAAIAVARGRDPAPSGAYSQ